MVDKKISLILNYLLIYHYKFAIKLECIILKEFSSPI